MAPRLAGSLLPLLLLLAATIPAGALRFDMHSGHTKCISDDIKVGAMAVGKYHIVAPDDGSLSSSSSSQQQLPETHRISLRVTSPYGNTLHYSENVQSGNFGFTASEAGDYLACFWAPDHRPPATIAFEFDWRIGVSAKDRGTVAKKGQVDNFRFPQTLLLQPPLLQKGSRSHQSAQGRARVCGVTFASTLILLRWRF